MMNTHGLARRAMRCGACSVFSVIEQVADVPADVLLSAYQPERLAAHMDMLAPTFMDSAASLLHLTFGSWIVRTPQHVVLIDSCIGNEKSRPNFPPFDRQQTDYLLQLERLGLSTDDIDVVCCTHLHADHCGWNTRLVDGRWVPTFPKARYVFSRKELDYWTSQIAGSMGPHEGVYQDSVLPVIEAGLAEIIDGSWAIDDHLQVRPAPGHTAGQYAVHLGSGATGAVFCGDVVHHPAQVIVPEWNSAFCQLPELAVQTRRSMLEHVAAQGSLLIPAHFGGSGFGTVTDDRGRFSFNPCA